MIVSETCESGKRIITASKKFSTVREIAEASGTNPQYVAAFADQIGMDIEDLPYWDAPKNLVHVPSENPCYPGFELSPEAVKRLRQVRARITKRQMNGIKWEPSRRKLEKTLCRRACK